MTQLFSYSSKKNRKAQGLSLNTIIIAALVLIVLVVLAYMFTQKLGGFGESLANCDGRCQDTIECGDGVLGVYNADCKDDREVTGKYCCPD